MGERQPLQDEKLRQLITSALLESGCDESRFTLHEESELCDEDDYRSLLVGIQFKPFEYDDGRIIPTCFNQQFDLDKLTGEWTMIVGEDTPWPITYGNLFANMYFHAMPGEAASTGPLRLDNDAQVFFYEQEFYVLSNFSSFRLALRVREGKLDPRGTIKDFDTSEHAYHYLKFPGTSSKSRGIRKWIMEARSAHEAFKLAERYREDRVAGWDAMKVTIMLTLLRAKADQHEYVRRKLLETGDRTLIENSWRDPEWGWGPDRNGKNLLGKLWMQVRGELRGEANGRQHMEFPA